MIERDSRFVGFTAMVLTVLIGVPTWGADGPPDLTQNNKVDRKLTYNLGSTGLRGWIYTRAANFFESCQGRTTTASRQILNAGDMPGLGRMPKPA